MTSFVTIGRITVILATWVLIMIQNALANRTVTVAKYHKFYDHDDSSDSEKFISWTSSRTHRDPDCLNNRQWFCFNSTAKTHMCLCHGTGDHTCFHIRCLDSGPLLKLGFCATYSDDTGLVTVTECPYFQMKGYNVSLTGDGYYIQLPKTLAELNNSMCGPMNRKSVVCSECIDGFGPSVTSIGYKCVNCTKAWYGVPLYIVLLFAPITVFYFFILVFQVKMTSPPTPCFIMYAQVIVMLSYFVDVEYKSAHVIVDDRLHTTPKDTR